MAGNEEKLHRAGLTLSIIQALLTSILPALAYYYVLQHDPYGIGPHAWTAWGLALIVGLLGVLAHGARSTTLTLIHLVFSVLFTTAFAAYFTAWFFVLDLQCSLTTASFNPSDTPRATACSAARSSSNALIIAFTGLAALAAATPTLCVDVQVLMAGAARRGVLAARLAAIRVGVEQQTRLVAAGDKPTVTPGTLCDWVGLLMAKGDASAKLVAERCRAALRGRGYELPLTRNGESQRGGAPSAYVAMGTPAAAAVGFDTAGDRGRINRPRRQQITPEDTPLPPLPAFNFSSSSYV